MALVLIDAGPVIAYFDQSDDWHQNASVFIDSFTGQFVTTEPVVTEVMWQLRADYRVQNEFLLRLSLGVFQREALMPEDYARIAELNLQYADHGADFADLSLIAVSERLDLQNIVSIDKEFDYFRRRRGHKTVPLKRISPCP